MASNTEYFEISKIVGTGNDSFDVSVLKENTGRNTKKALITATNDDASANATSIIPARDVFFTDDFGYYEILPDVGSVTIQGKSNASKLNINYGSLKAGEEPITIIPQNGTGISTVIQNNVAISGDPGKEEQYKVNIPISLGLNSSNQQMTYVVTITPYDGNNAGSPVTVRIIQSGNQSSIQLSPTEITLKNTVGDTKTINVTANGTWTLTIEEITV